jgi:hypothetical protein
MKTIYICLILTLFTGLNLMQGQENEYSNVRMLIQGGIGNSIVENDNEVNYVLNTNNAEILLSYRFSNYFGVAAGIGFNELRGNGFNSLGNFYHERNYIKIPVLLTGDYDVSDKIKVLFTLGVYTQNIIKDEYSFVSNKVKNVYEGWNFGTQMSFGFLFEIFENYSFGLAYLGQSDFSKLETNHNAIITDKQKIVNLNSVGLTLLFEF